MSISTWSAITEAAIARMAPNPATREAGRAYARQERVIEVELQTDIGCVSAMVQGQYRYYVLLALNEDGDLETDCTCPVGGDCKHCVAVAYTVMSQEEAHPGIVIAAAPAAPGAVSPPVQNWLTRIDGEATALDMPLVPLRFMVSVKRAAKASPAAAKGKGKTSAKTGAKAGPSSRMAPGRMLLQIEPYVLPPGQGGRWHVVQPWEIGVHRWRADPAAHRLLIRMAPQGSGGDFDADKMPHGAHGWAWWTEAVELGLLFWKSADNKPVTLMADVNAGPFTWRTLDDGHQMLALAGLLPEARIAASNPPLLVDDKTGAIARLDTGIDPALAARLLAMPPLSPADAAALAPRWPELVGDTVPAPVVPDQIDISGPPRPVLRLMIDQVKRRESGKWSYHVWQHVPTLIARLAFDYAGHRLDATAKSQVEVVQGRDGLVRIVRDLAAEQAAADRLPALGFRPLTDLGDTSPRADQAWDHVLDRDDGYPGFLVNVAPGLQREGWTVEMADDWPLKLLPCHAADLRLDMQPIAADDSPDWFDIALPARVGEARIDILPALREALAGAGAGLLGLPDSEDVALRIDAQSFTMVPMAKIRPLLETLLRLGLAGRGGEKLRLNRYDMGTIHELAGDGIGWASANALRQLARTLHDPARAGYLPPEGLHAELRPYQQAGAAWLHALHGAGFGGILADDMGLGKTLQAIAHLLGKRSGQHLVVAPTSVLPNWQAELARFAPGLRCHLWHGAARHDGAAALAGADVVLTSYPLLARDKARWSTIDWSVVVLDEAHTLKNPATAGFKAAAALKAGQVVALTGTPIENRLDDIWALASLTNPGLLGRLDSFRKTYRTPIEKQGDPAARAALARRLRPFMLRRTKDEVAAELPPKTVVSQRIELADAQLRLYEAQRLLMHDRVRDEIARVGLLRAQIVVLDAMLKLRQICCDPSLLPGGMGEGVPGTKRARLLEMVSELVSEGRRVVVFSQFTTMLDRISADLDAAGVVHAQLRGSTRERASPVRRFQQGEVAVILVSLKAGGAGINLTAADTVILYDPWWNPAVEVQAIDRAHRLGQDKPVFVHRLIAAGTIEEKILTLQDRKRDLADLLWSEAPDTGQAALSDEDIAFLLG